MNPFERIREWLETTRDTTEIANHKVLCDLEDLLADIDPADDGSPFGWGSQACATEPPEFAEERRLREEVLNDRLTKLCDVESESLKNEAHAGFVYLGRNINWMTREELLAELGYESLEKFTADLPENQPRIAGSSFNFKIRADFPKICSTVQMWIADGNAGGPLVGICRVWKQKGRLFVHIESRDVHVLKRARELIIEKWGESAPDPWTLVGRQESYADKREWIEKMTPIVGHWDDAYINGDVPPGAPDWLVEDVRTVMNMYWYAPKEFWDMVPGLEGGGG